MAKVLTIEGIKALRPHAARREVPDGHTRGLYFVLQSTGSASWAFRYRFAGKSQKLTLGPHPALDLRAARQKALEAATAVAKGEGHSRRQGRRSCSGEAGGADPA